MACPTRSGPLSYSENEQEVFLGHSITQQKNVSEQTAHKIDLEVRKIIDEAYARARGILSDNLEALHRLANALLEYESLNGEEIEGVLKGESIVRTDDDEPVVTQGRRGTGALLQPAQGQDPARPRALTRSRAPSGTRAVMTAAPQTRPVFEEAEVIPPELLPGGVYLRPCNPIPGAALAFDLVDVLFRGAPARRRVRLQHAVLSRWAEKNAPGTQRTRSPG